MAYIGREPVYGSLVKQTLTPDGVQTNFTLDYSVSTAASLIVSVSGVIQNPDTAYTITSSGSVLTFDEAPAAGSEVFVVYLGVQVLVGTVGDDTITTSKLTDNAVTTVKLATNAVTTGILADNAVTTAKLADNAVTTSKLANTGVTSNTYGGGSSIPVIAVGPDGRITSASNVNITSNSNVIVTVINSNTTAVSGVIYVANAYVVLTLPGSPSVGNQVGFTNQSNVLTSNINRNGSNINGIAESMTVDAAYASMNFVYSGVREGWVII
jgi:hypothetical protein